MLGVGGLFSKIYICKEKFKGGGGMFFKWCVKITCFQQKNFLTNPWVDQYAMLTVLSYDCLTHKLSIHTCDYDVKIKKDICLKCLPKLSIIINLLQIVN